MTEHLTQVVRFSAFCPIRHLREWCGENCTGRFHIEMQQVVDHQDEIEDIIYTARFESVSDETLFKLVWL